MVLEPSVGDGTGWGHGSGARFGARVWGTVLEHGLGDGLGDRGLEHGFWSPVWGTGAWFWEMGARFRVLGHGSGHGSGAQFRGPASVSLPACLPPACLPLHRRAYYC